MPVGCRLATILPAGLRLCRPTTGMAGRCSRPTRMAPRRTMFTMVVVAPVATQVTKRDEQGRRKRYTKDVLGRLVKVEELNWNQTVYSTTTYTLNAARSDHTINQAGQTRSFAYDGHGRLQSRTTPEQGTISYSTSVTMTRRQSLTLAERRRLSLTTVADFRPASPTVCRVELPPRRTSRLVMTQRAIARA